MRNCKAVTLSYTLKLFIKGPAPQSTVIISYEPVCLA